MKILLSSVETSDVQYVLKLIAPFYPDMINYNMYTSDQSHASVTVISVLCVTLTAHVTLGILHYSG